MKQILLLLIKMYKLLLSPLFLNSCRFYPSCSDYAYEAIQTFGCIKGSFLAFKRIMKCHPFHPGGYDPVPTKHHFDSIK
ncbi:MAG TPA: membrane protein insertion efficiency factor YidD [Candidatus Kapabacteria bacterium]|nr:membrane protein insertion efficiency factor YidD [Candidatus Kapabacteria bacterium]